MLKQSSTVKEIIPPTGEGIPCTCQNGPKTQDGKRIITHHHGEFHHLMSHIRHGKFRTGVIDA